MSYPKNGSLNFKTSPKNINVCLILVTPTPARFSECKYVYNARNLARVRLSLQLGMNQGTIFSVPYAPEQTVEQTIDIPVIWDTVALITTSL